MKSLGGWHEVVVKEVIKLGAVLGRHSSQEEVEAVSHLFQRLSIRPAKGNAALFNNRIPEYFNQTVNCHIQKVCISIIIHLFIHEILMPDKSSISDKMFLT